MIFKCLIFVYILKLSFAVELDKSGGKINKFSLKDCKINYNELCFKMDIVHFIEKLSNTKEIHIFKRLTITKEQTENDTSSAEIVAGDFLLFLLFTRKRFVIDDTFLFRTGKKFSK